jgi:photosystem II stability/assembly factor-like uncharacterized protein
MHSVGWILLCLLPVVLVQWQPQDAGTQADFRGVCAVSAQVAWASGTQGTVLRTVDGGKRWEKVSVPGEETLDFRDVQAFDAQEASVLSIGPGEKSRIYKTNDGGGHWRLVFTNPDAKAFYDSFAFWDRKHGIAMSDSVEGRFPLLITEDGETWKPLVPEVMPPALPEEGGFAASGTCIAVSGKHDVWFATGGPAARVFHSADRGRRWEVVTTPILSGAPSQGIFSIAFQDTRHGVIVGGDYSAPQVAQRTAAVTQDGGKNWTLAEKAPLGFRSAVAFLPAAGAKLWVTVGTGGSDYSRDGGRTWLPFDTGNYNATSFAGPHTGWAVGPKGRIAHFTLPPDK